MAIFRGCLWPGQTSKTLLPVFRLLPRDDHLRPPDRMMTDQNVWCKTRDTETKIEEHQNKWYQTTILCTRVPSRQYLQRRSDQKIVLKTQNSLKGYLRFVAIVQGGRSCETAGILAFVAKSVLSRFTRFWMFSAIHGDEWLFHDFDASAGLPTLAQDS